MNEKIKTICLILITVVILAGARFYHYQKVERKSQACRKQCEYKFHPMAIENISDETIQDKFFICIENCREKYGK